MKINQKILSIPPYISTAWKNVISLHLQEKEGNTVLMIGLYNGSTIEIPHLDKPILEAVFASHQNYLEKEDEDSPSPKGHSPIHMIPPGLTDPSSALMSLPLQFGLESNMGNLLQHNPEASDTPDLPLEMLEKIATLSKVVGLEKTDSFPKPEPHCNCMHCQIMGKIHQELEENSDQLEQSKEIEVSDDDLKFREWDIQQTGDEFYTVANPLNQKEHYSVFLGNPIGCTCGKSNCEHVRAVLNS